MPLLAESPVWLADENRVVWVDIERGVMHAADENGCEVGVWELYARCGRIGAVVPCVSRRLLLMCDAGLVFFDMKTCGTETLFTHQWENDLRFNDAKADPQGRLWCGTISLSRTRGAAALFRFNGEQLALVLPSLTNSNGLAWSIDGATFYHIDTPTREVAAYNFCGANGEINRESRRVVARWNPAGIERPDGMTIDNEGMIWVAHYEGGVVSRWNPARHESREQNASELKEIARIPQPSSRVTSCTFGGRDLRTLFVTIANQGLFGYKTAFTGIEPHRFRDE